MTLPNGLGVATADPSIHSSTVLAAFDGTIDFAGASGENLTGLTGTELTSSEVTGDLSAFVGAGTIALPIAADSPSVLTGPADLATELLTEAGATVTISYTYAAPSESAGLTYLVPNGSTPIPSGTTPDVTAPTISGIEAGQGVTDQTTVAPFTNVLITDRNAGQTETVTVTQSAAGNGTLSQAWRRQLRRGDRGLYRQRFGDRGYDRAGRVGFHAGGGYPWADRYDRLLHYRYGYKRAQCHR